MLVRGLKYVGFLCVIACGLAATAVRAAKKRPPPITIPISPSKASIAARSPRPRKQGAGRASHCVGDGKFRGVGYIGGLPGDGWDGSPARAADGELKDGSVTIHNDLYDAVIGKGTLTLTTIGKPENGRAEESDPREQDAGRQGAKRRGRAVRRLDARRL